MLTIIIMEAETGPVGNLLSSKAAHVVQSHKIFATRIARVLYHRHIGKVAAQTLKM